MQLFLDLRGIVQKSRAQFWLNLVSKGETSHSWMDSEISLIASDWHMRLQWKVTIWNKNMIYIQERFHGCHWNLNVWQRVSRGMMIYDDLFFLQREGSIKVPFFGTFQHFPEAVFPSMARTSTNIEGFFIPRTSRPGTRFEIGCAELKMRVSGGVPRNLGRIWHLSPGPVTRSSWRFGPDVSPWNIAFWIGSWKGWPSPTENIRELML